MELSAEIKQDKCFLYRWAYIMSLRYIGLKDKCIPECWACCWACRKSDRQTECMTNAWIRLSITLWSRLWTVSVWSRCWIVVLDPQSKKKKKNSPGYENKLPGSCEAVPGFWVTYSHATHVVAGPREVEGSSPAGQVTQSSQGLSTTIWPHLPCSLLLWVSMASTWCTAISDVSSTSHKHTQMYIYWINAYWRKNTPMHIHKPCTNLCIYDHIQHNTQDFKIFFIAGKQKTANN